MIFCLFIVVYVYIVWLSLCDFIQRISQEIDFYRGKYVAMEPQVYCLTTFLQEQ